MHERVKHTTDIIGISIYRKKAMKNVCFEAEIILCVRNFLEMNLNPSTTNVPHHIETSQLICNANQLTGFYMMGNISC